MDRSRRNVLMILVSLIVIVVVINLIIKNYIKNTDPTTHRNLTNSVNSQVSENKASPSESVPPVPLPQDQEKPKENNSEATNPEDNMGYTGGQPLLQ